MHVQGRIGTHAQNIWTCDQSTAIRRPRTRIHTLAEVPELASVPLIASFGTSGLASADVAAAAGAGVGVLVVPTLFALAGGGDLAEVGTGGDLADGAGEGEPDPLDWTARRAPGGM